MSSYLIHCSVGTGRMSCLPTTSFPILVMSLTPSSTIGIPVRKERKKTLTLQIFLDT